MFAVSSGALVSKTTVAWAWTWVPVVSADCLGLDRVGDEAFAAAGGIVGGQEAGQRVGRHVEGRRVERGEGPGDQAGLEVDACRDVDQDAERRRRIDPGAVGGESLRDLDEGRAKADLAELEGVPVEVGVELFGDRDDLCRRGGGGLVFEEDGVGKRAAGLDEALGAVAGWAAQVVGVAGDDGRGMRLVGVD